MPMNSDLRDLMTAVDVPPSRADVGRAVADGRRRSRRRAVLGAAAAVLVVAGSLTAVEQLSRGSAPAPLPVGGPSIPPSPPPGCNVEWNPIPGSVDAVDETGQYVVGTASVANTPTPVRWQGRKPTTLTG